MEESIYIIEFCRNSEDVLYDYEKFSDNDKKKMSNIDTSSSFDFDDEHGNYTCYILIQPSEFEKYKKVLDDNIIPYICTDISQNVIKNNINLEKRLIKYCYIYNENSHSNFIKRVNEWITSNLDLDLVLDMINEKGINSLRRVYRNFLEGI